MRIAISGAGVAGPTLAHFLLRQGHEPLIIERAPAFRRGGFVIDFWGTGYQVAERLGLIGAVRESGYQVAEVRLVGADGRRRAGLDARVFARATGDRFTSLPRGDLAGVLWDALGGRVDTRFGESIAGIDEDALGLTLTLEGGGRERVDLLVGADGLHSRVRALRWGPSADYERPLGYHVAAYEIAGYPRRDEDVYVSYAEPGLSVSRFALRGGRTLVLLVFSDRHLPPGTIEPAAMLRRVFGGCGWEVRAMLEALPEGEALYLDRVAQSVVPDWHRGRCVLLGDAAACPSLLAGEGTGLAMTAACVLAAELATGDWQVAFPAYEARLRRFIEGKQKSARGFARSFAPGTRLGIRLREWAVRAMRVPAIADLLIGNSLRDDFTLPPEG